MKAVLVIDGIPDNFSIDNLCAYFKLLNYSDGNMKEVGLEGKIKLEPYKEAIPKEWIKRYVRKNPSLKIFIDIMLMDWEKERCQN